MMLERNFILPNYDFKQPNEKIPFDEWGFKVPVRQQPWPLGKRWASVNGFGFGGTNGHVVVSQISLECSSISLTLFRLADESTPGIESYEK
jgi:acyl transferase domain-containing protein